MGPPRERPLLPPAARIRSTQISREQEVAPEPEQGRISLVIGKRAVCGFKVRTSASNRRTMIENIAVTVNPVLVETWKMDALILEFNFP